MQLTDYDSNPIKVDPELYYNPQRLIKYENRGKLMLYAYGGRRIGKSYGVIRDVGMKRFVESGCKDQFLYIRRYMTDYTQMDKFFDRYSLIESEPVYIREGWSVKPDSNQGGFFLYKGETAGYYSTIFKMQKKGCEFPNVQDIIFDEFIAREGERYLEGEYNAFIAMVLSICNFIRPVHVYMLANPVSMYNPYFLNMNYKYSGQEFWVNPDKDGLGMANASVVQKCVTDPRLEEVFKSSPWGRAIYDTEYGQHALYNKSLTCNEDFIRRKSRFAEPAFAFVSGGQEFSVWMDLKTKPYTFFISKSDTHKNVNHYVINYQDREFGYLTLRELQQTPVWIAFTKAYDKGYLFYEDEFCEGAGFELLKKGWRV